MIAYIGIDPGKSGGIAVVDGYRPPVAWRMPDNPRALAAILRSVRSARMCLMEDVWSSSQMGVRSAFTFGRGRGQLEGVLAAFDIRYETAGPKAWQGEYGLVKAGNNAKIGRNAGKKAATKACAISLWPAGISHGTWEAIQLAGAPDPAATITHAVADALLIAEYARRRGL